MAAMWFERRFDRQNETMGPTDEGWQVMVANGLVMDHCSVSPYEERSVFQGRPKLTAQAFSTLLMLRQIHFPDEFLAEEDQGVFHAV